MTSESALYRANVGIALFNRAGLVFLGRRIGAGEAHGWQMPQGGVDEGETWEAAALRELFEETGVRADRAASLGTIEEELIYEFPPEVLAKRRFAARNHRGQRQRWFAFRFLGEDGDVNLDAHGEVEFSEWRWERLEATPALVIPWKRAVYERVAEAFAPFAVPVDAG